jgi:hypothetical protein
MKPAALCFLYDLINRTFSMIASDVFLVFFEKNAFYLNRSDKTAILWETELFNKKNLKHKMMKMFRGLKALTGLALATGLMTAVSLTSCKKASLDKADEQQSKVRMEAAGMKISVEEIYAQLPQTIMHNLADKVKIDVTRAEWIYEKDYLMVRIPLNDAVNKSYLYAVKYYSDPIAKPRVYLSQFIPDNADDSKPTDFSGKQIWINLQDWQIYGVQFEHNMAVGYMQPVPIDPPNWETEMLDAGYFYLDENDKIAVYDEPKQSVMVLRGGGPRDHGDPLFSNGPAPHKL